MPARRCPRPGLAPSSRGGLPLGARDERGGRAAPDRHPRPSDSVAVRESHPRLAELGDDEYHDGPGGVMALTQIPTAARSVVVRRIGEPIQSDTDLLTRLRGAGLRPNAVMLISRVGDRVRIGTGSQVVELDETTAAHVFVTAA